MGILSLYLNHIFYFLLTFRKRKDLDVTKCLAHEKSVSDVTATISSMTNPFIADQVQLVSISSGIEVEEAVSDSILTAEQLGEKQFSEFCKDNLFSDNPDIFRKIKQNKLTSSTKKVTVKDSKGQQIAVKTSRNFFARLLVMSKTREVNLKELLSYSLSDYPLSIATVSGDPVKTAKSKMLEILEGVTDSPEVDPTSLGDHNALIVDAMAILQVVKGKWKTFGEFADSTFTYLVKLALKWNAVRLDFVADRYPEISIKNVERARRAAQGVQKVHILNKNQSLPKQWKKYMSSGENKESLVAFLADHWSTYYSSELNSLQCMYVTSKTKCHLLTPGVSQTDPIQRQDVPELESDHEEADTRLLLHSKHAADSHDHIIIKTPDTDVFILCTAMQKAIGKDLMVMTGTGNKFRLIDTTALSDALGEELSRCLPGFHAFSGNI